MYFIRNNLSDQQRQAQENYNRQQAAATDTLIRQLAQRNLEAEALKKSIEESNSGTRKSKSKKSDNKTGTVQTNNDDLEREIARLRRQMAVQNTALIAGGTAAVVVASSSDKGKNEVRTDTVRINQVDTTGNNAPVKSDTVYIRDTVSMGKNVQNSAYRVVPGQKTDPVYFEVNSAVINNADKKRLEDLALTVKQQENWKVELTGMTDPSGSVSANRKVAAARYSAVSSILLKNGVKDSQIIVGSKLATSYNIQSGDTPRKVEIRILEK